MASAIPAVIGAGASLFGASRQENAIRDQQRAQQAMLNRLAQVNFDPKAAVDPFGTGVSFDQQGRPIFDFGQFGPINEMLGVGSAGDVAQGSGLQQSALGRADFARDAANLDRLNAFGMQDILNLRTGGFGDQGNTGRQFGLSNLLASEATQGFDDLRADTLGRLDELARPQEERAFANLQDNLFATGRIGSTGGALQTEAFARGLGDAATARSLQADQVARQARNDAIAGSATASNVGQQLLGLEDSLYANALNRFAGTLGLDQDLRANEFDFGSALFNQGLTGLGAQSGILDQLIQMGQFGANLGGQEASTRISALGGSAGGLLQQPLQGDALGGLASQLGSNILGGTDLVGDVSSAIGGKFGNNQAATPAPAAPSRPGGK